ncbi:M48 family metalloprotease [Streptomyces sp. NPDC058001]|uniref:M48 family metalloprotease n=1 Tax=Streptomyces sp. NPDC058001 TaxID=3346300 RepID=UPI0036E49C57
MTADVYLPLALPVVLSAVSPLVGRRVAPALAARVLTTAAVLSSAATVWVLFLLIATLVGEAPPVAADALADGRHLPEPVPEAVALAAMAGLGVIVHRLCRVARAERATRRMLRRLGEGHPPDTELIVADSEVPRAFAVPGSPGRILVTAAMFSALAPAERRVLLAHERAHLTHRHASLATAVAVAAAANPLLTPVRTTVTYLLERWADEEAAGAVGDRATAARALARAALVAHRSRPGCALAFSDHAVTRRLAALRATPPPHLRVIGLAVLALGILPAIGAADATGDIWHLVNQALD